MPRRIVLAAASVSLMLGLVAATPAIAQAPSRCAAVLGGSGWIAAPTDSVEVEALGVPDGRLARFLEEIELSAASIASDIGGLDGGVVCLVADPSAVDTSGYVEGTGRFHAILDADAGVLALSTENPGNIKPAAAFGLAHLALWNASEGTGFPEPLASAIAHWYRGVALDRMAQYHKYVQGADFRVNLQTGESNFGLDFSTEPRIDWFTSQQPAVLAWDPTTNEVPIGDFIDHVVATEGVDALVDLDPAAWTAREGAWRTDLVADLTGRTTPTTAWRIGVIVAVVLVGVAAVIAVGGWWSKRKRNRGGPPEAPTEPMPGWFSSSKAE